MVDLFPVKEKKDEEELKAMIEAHLKYTQSSVAKKLLENWGNVISQFVKVYPRDFRKIVEDAEKAAQAGAVKK